MSAMDRPSCPPPTHFVTARHSAKVRGGVSDAGPRPFGIQHARTPGSTRTACGEPALDWQMFWELPFPTDSHWLCEHCLTAYDARRQSRLHTDFAGGVR